MTTNNWTPEQPIVSVKDVYKSFGELEVLKGISFDVMKGEVICIIGPSGSGKSTLIRCINALNDINSGSIKVHGLEVNDPDLNKLELRKNVGMVFQQYNLFPHKTTLENVMMAPMLVASWINLQYYASTVVPGLYGAGNKLLHSVVGGHVGVIEGNSPQLRIGLPEQSLRDGEKLHHEPLRLTVVIDAPRERIEAIIERQPVVADLINHRWLWLTRMGDNGLERYSPEGWQPVAV
mgnify:CR=1 FL=1